MKSVMKSVMKNYTLVLSGLTDSATIQEYCNRHHAKVKLSQQNSGGILFSVVGQDDRLLTPMFSTGRGLLEHLYEITRKDESFELTFKNDIRETL